MSEGERRRTLLLGIDTSGSQPTSSHAALEMGHPLALAELHPDGRLELLAQQSLNPRQQSAEFLPKLSLLLEQARVPHPSDPGSRAHDLSALGWEARVGLLNTSGMTIDQLNAIIVVHGPGSFTGLRIGLSAVKGLAEAAQIPLIAISTLAVLAHSVGTNTAAVLQAGRGEYYVSQASQESLVTEHDLAAILGAGSVVIADAALLAKLPLPANGVVGKTGAYAAILAALPRFLAADFDDTATLDANYVRRPYTEVNAEAKATP